MEVRTTNARSRESPPGNANRRSRRSTEQFAKRKSSANANRRINSTATDVLANVREIARRPSQRSATHVAANALTMHCREGLSQAQTPSQTCRRRESTVEKKLLPGTAAQKPDPTLRRHGCRGRFTWADS
jgi:hypothetical protein